MAVGNATRSRTLAKWEEPSNLILLRGWARDGFTYKEMSEKMGISHTTLDTILKRSELIRAAISEGREVTDYKVENALLKAALGFKKKEVKVITVIRDGEVAETRREVLHTQQPPNVYACQSWLYNRRPDKWCKNPETKFSLESDETVSIIVTRAGGDETGTRPNLDENVNKFVTVRGMSEDEKKNQNTKTVDENDLDYWPDDWVDD